MSDAYADLGLRGPLEDLEAIKAVYAKKARKHHPDKGGDAREFDKVTQAWELLQDPARKAALDAELLASERVTAGSSASSGTGSSTHTAAGEGLTGPRRRTATATAPVIDENPWLDHAQSITTAQRTAPWFTPAAASVVFAAIWLLAVSTAQSPAELTIEMFGEPPASMLRAWGLTALAWGLVLLLVPALLPVALIIAGLSGVATVALYGTGYPVAHGLAVGFTLLALIHLRNARTSWSAMRALHLRRNSVGAVLGAPTTVGQERLAGLASEIAQNTAGAWSGTFFKVGSTVVHLVFVGVRAGALISADHVPLPSRVLGGTDWQRVAAALDAGDISRIRKALDSHGFAPSIYVVTGPGTGGSENVALDKHTTVTMLSPGMASAVIGSALVLEQNGINRRPVHIAKAINALHSR